MQLSVFCTLFLNVLLNGRLVAMLPDGADEIARAPELSAPQLLLDFRAGLKDFSGRDALDDLHNPFGAVERHRLHQEMHVILICSTLKESDLVSFADLQAYLFKLFIHAGRKDNSPVLGRANDVVQQN